MNRLKNRSKERNTTCFVILRSRQPPNGISVPVDQCPGIPNAGEILPQHNSTSDVREVPKRPPQCHSSLTVLLMSARRRSSPFVRVSFTHIAGWRIASIHILERIPGSLSRFSSVPRVRGVPPVPTPSKPCPPASEFEAGFQPTLRPSSPDESGRGAEFERELRRD